MKTIKSQKNKSIIFVPLFLITAFIVVGLLLIDLFFENAAIERYEKTLIQKAKDGAQVLMFLDENSQVADYDSFADRIVGANNFRVTIISENGLLIGDSKLSLNEVLEQRDYGKRPEIIQAQESGIGLSRRYSQTLDMELFYVTVRYNNKDQRGFFRIATTLQDLEQELINQRFVLGAFCLVFLLIASILSLTASRYLLNIVKKEEAYLEKKVRDRTTAIETLLNLGTHLSSCNLITEAREVIKMTATRLLPRFSGALTVFHHSRKYLEVIETWNGEWEGKQTYTPDMCWALRSGLPHIGNLDSGNISCGHSKGQDHQVLCLPLMAQGETHGVLHFSSQKDLNWTPNERQMASGIAEHVSLAFASLTIRENLQEQAIRDPLTTLFNRRYLTEIAEQEISRATRYTTPLGFLMIDLDHFKKFNDTHGHDIGDFILKEFATLVKKTIREEDIPCRYGGEEFSIILPETDSNGVLNAAEKIRSCVEAHNFFLNDRSYGQITVSIGGAVFPIDGNSLEQLIKKADIALYDAKAEGRNKVLITSCESD